MRPTSFLGRTSRPSSTSANPVPYGYVDGILTVLRVDPEAATAAFDVRVSDDGLREAIFAGGRGFLDFRIRDEEQTVLVYDVTWIG